MLIIFDLTTEDYYFIMYIAICVIIDMILTVVFFGKLFDFIFDKFTFKIKYTKAAKGLALVFMSLLFIGIIVFTTYISMRIKLYTFY